MPETTVTKTTWEVGDGNERVQYRTTVPKGLAEAFDLDGATLEWEVETGDKMTVTKIND